jgi:hypothetical protein
MFPGQRIQYQERTVSTPNVKFAKVVYWSAGVWGVLILTPLYFIFNMIGLKDPPPITHPLFYYGFAGVGLAWQAAFMIIATCPARYRQMMIATWLEKLAYGVPAWILYMQGRLRIQDAAIATIDLIWLVLFIAAYLKTPTSTD